MSRKIDNADTGAIRQRLKTTLFTVGKDTKDKTEHFNQKTLKDKADFPYIYILFVYNFPVEIPESGNQAPTPGYGERS